MYFLLIQVLCQNVLGEEYGIVILSTVCSLPLKEIANLDNVQAHCGWLLENLGFPTDEHQLNVGIAQSKYDLIIVGMFQLFTCMLLILSIVTVSRYILGNKHLLSHDKDWKALIDHYEERGCMVEADAMNFYDGISV